MIIFAPISPLTPPRFPPPSLLLCPLCNLCCPGTPGCGVILQMWSHPPDVRLTHQGPHPARKLTLPSPEATTVYPQSGVRACGLHSTEPAFLTRHIARHSRRMSPYFLLMDKIHGDSPRQGGCELKLQSRRENHPVWAHCRPTPHTIVFLSLPAALRNSPLKANYGRWL